jgi:vesicle-associated membrane protein 7
MAILGALVAFGTKILTKHTVDTSKNFSNASLAILAKIPPKNSCLTYAAEDYLFHYVENHDVVFVCMSKESLGRKIPFTFLNNLQNKFFNQFSQSNLASTLPYGLISFNTKLVTLLTGYSLQAAKPSQPQQASSSNHQIKLARSELASVKDIMIKNVGEILNRGEQIKLLLNKTNNLSAQSSAFRKCSPLATQVVVGRR